MHIPNAMVVMVLAGAGAIGAGVDIRTRRIPNVLTLTLALVGIAMALMRLSGVTPAQALVGLVIALGLMLPAHVIGALGAGDVKLFAASGTLLGPATVPTAFIYTVLAGGVLALGAAAWRRRLGSTAAGVVTLLRTGGANSAALESASANNRFAFAPAIVIGTLVAALGF